VEESQQVGGWMSAWNRCGDLVGMFLCSNRSAVGV
jgi:hypothetical protein